MTSPTVEGQSGSNASGLRCLNMSVNNSSSVNGSLPSQSFYPPPCSACPLYVFIASTFANILLLLPLSIFVLYLGFQRWKKQRSVSSAAVMCISDFMTYNMAVMELIGVLGNTVCICGLFISLPWMVWVGKVIGGFPWSGQMLFPMLTCVERYLAVVHPITYLRLRQGHGVRIRNISTMCVWLQCFVWIAFLYLMISRFPEYIFVPSACQMVLFLIGSSFCSLSILRALSRPRPGQAGGDRVGVHQSKRRAFRTIILIMGVLLLKFGGNLVCSLVATSQSVSHGVREGATVSAGWFNLPSSLVLPLLFLHRAGKLPGCKHTTDPG